MPWTRIIAKTQFNILILNTYTKNGIRKRN
uniref:Uncharacterized protein n=1 Tax=virus sp. ct1Uu26 TaxID=2826789 RepID=A0A8S5R8V8_9VIRU|nr:MAG TPA: hypothetical protein [virus sp. ct1Uu26]